MQFKPWLCVCTSAVLALSTLAMADRDHGKHHDRNNDHGKWAYSDHDRDEMRHWHHVHDRYLPPGLAKRDQLPPGLEKQLRVRGTLPPGLRKRMRPCPEELVRRLPPPPPNYIHTVIGGHLVLVNRSTYMVVDIFHFDE